MPPWINDLLMLLNFQGVMGGNQGGNQSGGPTPFGGGNPLQDLFDRQAPGSVSRNLTDQFGFTTPARTGSPTPSPIAPNPNTNVRTVGPLSSVSQSGLPVFAESGPTSKIALPVTGNPDMGWRAPTAKLPSITDLFTANQRRQDMMSRTTTPFKAPPLALSNSFVPGSKPARRR